MNKALATKALITSIEKADKAYASSGCAASAQFAHSVAYSAAKKSFKTDMRSAGFNDTEIKTAQSVAFELIYANR